MQKSCTVCHQELPLTEFVKNRSTKDGHGSWCRCCHNFKALEWRNNNLEKRRAYDREYIKRPGRRAQLTSNERRRRATKRGLRSQPYDVDHILKRDKGVCSLCGFDVDPKNFHVDHTVPMQVNPASLLAFGLSENPGDVPWNVSVSHPSCNISKGNRMTQEDVNRYLLWSHLYGE